jgi:hypothetical protein
MPRCRFADEACGRQAPTLRRLGDGAVSCHRSERFQVEHLAQEVSR